MKKKYRIYKLDPGNSPFHLSRGRSDYDDAADLLHSDTLKSALFIAALEMYEKSIANEKFFSRFRMSSAFPYYKGELFFPKPFIRTMKIDGIEDAKQGKPLKKLKYMGLNYLMRHLKGFDPNRDRIPAAHLIDGGVYLSDHPDVISDRAIRNLIISRKTVRQRVSIPSLAEAGVLTEEDKTDPTPFYFEQTHFNRGAGLFVMAELTADDAETDTMLQACFRWLGDHGVGTDRSVGYGHFTLAGTDMIELESPEPATHQMNLSLYCPKENELDQSSVSSSAYQLIKRGGWIAGAANPDHRSYRRKSVYMFAEGSVFPFMENRNGKLADLQPEIMKGSHPVYRCGQPLFLPLKQRE